jgi:hypothetical protein
MAAANGSKRHQVMLCYHQPARKQGQGEQKK